MTEALTAPWTPLRWPGAWRDPSALSLLKGTAIDYLLIDPGNEFDAVRSRARQDGLRVAEAGAPPAGVHVVKGEWPGVRMRGGGAAAQASAGPTGTPWIDSNGWNVRLAAALDPDSVIWVEAAPQANARVSTESHLVAIADAAAYGARLIIAPDAQLAAGLASGQAQALANWKRIAAATQFFAAHKEWAGYPARGVAGVISDFTGDNEFFGQEMLNLLSRAGLHYRILLKSAVAKASFEGLRAVIYADAQPPSAELRKQVLAFVEAGGMLITVPKWGAAPGAPAKNEEHPRYGFRTSGKGIVAMANEDQDDPWVMANDAAILVSHRYDLVRFWNGGATGSYYTVSPDRKQAVVHLLFYSNRGPDSASVRIVGRYRTAKVSTVDVPAVENVELKPEKDAVELHLPQVSQYVAVQLEV